jgi:hypothetical protein
MEHLDLEMSVSAMCISALVSIYDSVDLQDIAAAT